MTSSEQDLSTEHGLAGNSNQYLTFLLGDEAYGVDILKVQEIKGYVQTTRVPNAPPEVAGVLNLRGTIVPIIDLRRKFNLPAIQYDQFTAIIVVVVRDKVMGMIVDSVSEVASIEPGDIQPPPDFGNSMTSHMLSGMAKKDEQLIVLLDIENVLLGNDRPLALAA